MNDAPSYVASNFPRVADDNYVTVDPRCISVLCNNWDIPSGAVDPCTRGGDSGLRPVIAGAFSSLAEANVRAAITNPPYRLPDVDLIHKKLIQLVVDDELDVAATLMRVQWDCAKRRADYWQWPFAASIRLQFRPWWSDNRSKQPIHSYQWLVWDRRHNGRPMVIHGGAGS